MAPFESCLAWAKMPPSFKVFNCNNIVLTSIAMDATKPISFWNISVFRSSVAAPVAAPELFKTLATIARPWVTNSLRPCALHFKRGAAWHMAHKLFHFARRIEVGI